MRADIRTESGNGSERRQFRDFNMDIYNTARARRVKSVRGSGVLRERICGDGEASRAAVLSSELTKLAVKYPALFSRFRPAFRGAKKDTAEAVSFRCFALRSYAQGVTFTLVA